MRFTLWLIGWIGGYLGIAWLLPYPYYNYAEIYGIFYIVVTAPILIMIDSPKIRCTDIICEECIHLDKTECSDSDRKYGGSKVE